MAKPYKRKGSRFYWIAPWIGSRQVPQSSGETDYDRAARKLKILEGKIAANAPITARTDRDSLEALLELVKTNYSIKGRATLHNVDGWIRLHIVPLIGNLPTQKVTSAVLSDYIQARQIQKAANASINRELAVIKRAFRLGMRAGTVSHVPFVEMLPEAEPRSGYFTEEAFRSVLRHTDRQDLKDILVCCYYTGWRIKSVLAMEWRNVDFARDVIGLTTHQTKNRKATVFPLAPFPELKAMLEERHRLTKALERSKGRVIARVFHRDGRPVLDISHAWEGARDRAGQPGRIVHDLRRTAVRNLKRDGWSDTDIMNMVGLKTLSMLIRYNITTEDDILRKAERMMEARRALQKL